MPASACETTQRSIAETVEQILRHNSYLHFPGEERREHRRFGLSIEGSCQPLDGEFGPAGESRLIMTRDISESGISFYATTPLDTGTTLSVTLYTAGGSEYHLLAEVVRCRPIGFSFEHGCRFVGHS